MTISPAPLQNPFLRLRRECAPVTVPTIQYIYEINRDLALADSNLNFSQKLNSSSHELLAIL